MYPSQSSPGTNFSTPAFFITSDQGNALHEAAQPLTRTACVTRPNWLGALVDALNIYTNYHATNYVATSDFYTEWQSGNELAKWQSICILI